MCATGSTSATTAKPSVWCSREGRPGETYNIGGCNEKKNLEVVETICALLDELRPNPAGGHYRDLITFVKDRPGHDRRYAINADKIAQRAKLAAQRDLRDRHA